MQPYFFPYLGYFGLVHATDRWVVFDTPQYIRRGWVNRNRVLSNGAAGWKYARVPIAACDSTTSIRNVRIANRNAWQQELFNNLDAYRLRKAPYYNQTLSFLQNTLTLQTENLTELLVHCLRSCCDRLELPFFSESFSTMNLQLPDTVGPGDWALETSRHLGATQYINPPGGREIFSPDRFTAANIHLQFLHPALPAYDQGCREFLPGLSIIDALMWNHPSAVRDMVGDYQLNAA